MEIHIENTQFQELQHQEVLDRNSLTHRSTTRFPTATFTGSSFWLSVIVRTLIWRVGLGLIRQLMAAPAMSEWIEGEIGDRPQSPALEDFLRKNCISQWHPIGTCRVRTTTCC